MRVAMVTPMVPESAIADVMNQAVPELSQHWDLDIWCPASQALRPSSVRTVPYAQADADVLAALSEYDLVVYVLGDSEWHHRILPLARALPGLVVLHDASLTNLVLRTAQIDHWVDALVEHVRSLYGPERAAFLRDPGDAGGTEPWLQLCADVPLTEIATEGALGAVVHSAWHAERVDGEILGDVTVAPLPVPSPRVGFDGQRDDRANALLARLPRDATLLVSVGAVNANRKIDVLLEALADAPHLESVRLWAVGPSDGPAASRLAARARALGLGDRFAMTGRVGDSALTQILDRADIAAALRDPVIEGQSASVLTQMLSGLPVLVYDHAHYSELPDEAVVKVRPQDGAAGVRRALESLAADPDDRIQRGQRARDYVLASRSGSAYAAAILRAGDLALARKPQVHLAEDLGRALRRLGLHEEPTVVDTVGDLAFDLFDLA